MRKMSARWIALHCGAVAESLLSKHPNAFLLLTQIAMRAQWKDNPVTGIMAGEAFIGDYKNAGIHSQKAYRHAKDKLVSCMLARFKGANKGTVATLIGTSIFSTTAPDRGELGASKGRAGGEQGATTHTDTQENTDTLIPLPPLAQKKSKPKDGRTLSLEGIQFASWFKSSLPENMSLQSNWQETFGKAHDDLVRLDKRTPEEIKAVCQWARTDSFWQGNFYSPSKLRTRNKDGVSYWDLFSQKMKTPAPGSRPDKPKFKGIQETLDIPNL